MTLAESWMSFLRAHITTSTYAAKMAPTKHTTTGLLANVAKSSAVRETSTKFGITKKELPKKVRWLQRHWVTKGVVSGPTCQKKNNTVTGLSPVKKVWIKTMLACEYLPNPASIFTPRGRGFIPVFTLSSNRHDSDGGIYGSDAWLYDWLHDKVVNSSIACSVFGAQHPGEFLLY